MRGISKWGGNGRCYCYPQPFSFDALCVVIDRYNYLCIDIIYIILCNIRLIKFYAGVSPQFFLQIKALGRRRRGDFGVTKWSNGLRRLTFCELSHDQIATMLQYSNHKEIYGSNLAEFRDINYDIQSSEKIIINLWVGQYFPNTLYICWQNVRFISIK